MRRFCCHKTMMVARVCCRMQQVMIQQQPSDTLPGPCVLHSLAHMIRHSLPAALLIQQGSQLRLLAGSHRLQLRCRHHLPGGGHTVYSTGRVLSISMCGCGGMKQPNGND